MTDALPVTALPIASALPELMRLCASQTRVLLEAPPGAGKTSRVPAALHRARLVDGEIWVAEPRRLAAKLAAHRVASELGSRLGDLVGYTVRFDDCSNQATRIRFVTSGILFRRLLEDADLPGVGCVILDEFHERHLDTDLSLALLCDAQSRRPDLRLLVMSATLEGARLSQLLGDCPRVTSEGRLFPIEILYESVPDDRPLEKKVASALRQQLKADPIGSVLVFLPGAAEIRRAQAALDSLCEQASVELRILHGDLPLDAQAAAVRPGPRPRVVLTTNVAESSVTVDGITAVIDSGLCRKLDSPAFTGVSRLSVHKISRASATQRAGRAGRVAPGRAIRLYTKGDFQTRPEFDAPEIVGTDFSEALLLLSAAASNARLTGGRSQGAHVHTAASSVAQERSLEYLDRLLLLDRPQRTTLDQAVSLLRQLGGLDECGRITDVGRKMATLPLHPRLARLVVECDQRKIAGLGALAAALLTERDLRLNVRASLAGDAGSHRPIYSGDSDVIELVDTYLRCQRGRTTHNELRDQGVDPLAFHDVQRLSRQLLSCLRGSPHRLELDPRSETLLAQALLVAFPDRIAKRRRAESADLVLCSGAVARLDDASVVRNSEWLLAIDAEERRTGRGSGVMVRLASAISTDWLLDSVSELLVDEQELCWTDPPGRVEARSRLRIGSLIVEESRCAAKPGPKTAAILRRVLDDSGRLKSDEIAQLKARLELLVNEFGIDGLPADPNQVLERVLEDCLSTRIDLDGLDGAALASSLLANLPAEVQVRLRRETPEYVLLPHARRCTIHYEAGRPPWIASRLQDFFGQASAPTILSGRKKLVVELLAPNQRAVQITEDLGGFWVNHYPELRRQLLRRYPRHFWPEDGATARPPEPKPARRSG